MSNDISDDIRLRKEIRQLSSLLSGTCPYLVSESVDFASDALPFVHLANLLNIKQKQAIAVTGSINSGGILDAAILASSNPTSNFKRDKQDDSSDNLGYTSWKLAPSNITVEEVKQPKVIPTLNLELHASDVLAVLRLSHEKKIREDEVQDWMVSRSWALLKKRLAKSKEIRNGYNLVQVLEKYNPARSVIYGEVVVGTKEVEDLFHSLFRLAPVRDRVFPVDKSTARQWILVIARILDTMVQVVKELENPLDEDIKMVGDCLRLFQFLLKQQPIRSLLESLGISSIRFPQIFRQDRAEGEKQDSNEDEDPDHTIIAANETSRILRYLRTLVSWHDAVTYILRRQMLKFLASVEATFIQLHTDPLKDEKSEISQSLKEDIREGIIYELSYSLKYYICNRIMDENPELSELLNDDSSRTSKLNDMLVKKVLDWIDSKVIEKGMDGLEKPCEVHVEAGLVALACNVNRSGTDINKALQAETINIGVGEKCCYLCWRLYQLFRSTQLCHLRVPDMHGILYPWDVPHGVPTALLVKLRNDLMYQLINEAGSDIKMQYENSSQYSPLSESEDEFEPLRIVSYEHWKGIVIPLH